MARGRIIGIAAALTTVTIWAGWIVGTREAMTGVHDAAALGLLRFLVPAVLFAPVWLRTGLKPRGVPMLLVAGVAAGSGAPFFLLAATGMTFAPAADIGPLLPGTMPLAVALLSVLILGERLRGMRLAGFGLIALGVVTIAGRGLIEAGDGAWKGHVLFLCAATCWGVYTVSFRRSGLSAIEGAALSGVWSSLVLLPFGAPGIIEAVEAGSGMEILGQTVLQGFLSGVVALLTFGIAVSRLGASQAAAFAALTPGLATLLAIPLLNEWPDMASISGIMLTTLGVILATGIRGTKSPDQRTAESPKASDRVGGRTPSAAEGG